VVDNTDYSGHRFIAFSAAFHHDSPNQKEKITPTSPISNGRTYGATGQSRAFDVGLSEPKLRNLGPGGRPTIVSETIRAIFFSDQGTKSRDEPLHESMFGIQSSIRQTTEAVAFGSGRPFGAKSVDPVAPVGTDVILRRFATPRFSRMVAAQTNKKLGNALLRL